MKYPPAPLTLCLATLLQNLPLCSRCHSLLSIPSAVLSVCPSIACALLNSLASLFATPILCFQSFTDSFAKIGVGVPCASSRHLFTPSVVHEVELHFGSLVFSGAYKSPLPHYRSACLAFSNTYKSLFAQPLSFHIHTNCRGVAPAGLLGGRPGVAPSGRQASYGLRGKKRPQVQTANLSYRGCTLRLSGSITMGLIAGRRWRRRRLLNSTFSRRWRRTWRGISRPRTRPVWGR
jgi:hypothetical protein